MTFAASPSSKEAVTGIAHLRAVDRGRPGLPTLDEGDNLAHRDEFVGGVKYLGW
jgi:hypothetical protein